MSFTPSSGHIFSYDCSLHDGKELLPSHQEAESDRFGELKTTAVILCLLGYLSGFYRSRVFLSGNMISFLM